MAAKFRVNVFPNGAKEGGKAVVVQPGQSFAEFLASATAKVGKPCTRAFTEQGGELDSVDDMMANDKIFVSGGEAFQGPGGAQPLTPTASALPPLQAPLQPMLVPGKPAASPAAASSAADLLAASANAKAAQVAKEFWSNNTMTIIGSGALRQAFPREPADYNFIATKEAVNAWLELQGPRLQWVQLTPGGHGAQAAFRSGEEFTFEFVECSASGAMVADIAKDMGGLTATKRMPECCIVGRDKVGPDEHNQCLYPTPAVLTAIKRAHVPFATRGWFKHVADLKWLIGECAVHHTAAHHADRIAELTELRMLEHWARLTDEGGRALRGESPLDPTLAGQFARTSYDRVVELFNLVKHTAVALPEACRPRKAPPKDQHWYYDALMDVFIPPALFTAEHARRAEDILRELAFAIAELYLGTGNSEQAVFQREFSYALRALATRTSAAALSRITVRELEIGEEAWYANEAREALAAATAAATAAAATPAAGAGAGAGAGAAPAVAAVAAPSTRIVAARLQPIDVAACKALINGHFPCSHRSNVQMLLRHPAFEVFRATLYVTDFIVAHLPALEGVTAHLRTAHLKAWGRDRVRVNPTVLPAELWTEIAAYLVDGDSLSAFTETCSFFKSIVTSRNWMLAALHEFPGAPFSQLQPNILGLMHLQNLPFAINTYHDEPLMDILVRKDQERNVRTRLYTRSVVGTHSDLDWKLMYQVLLALRTSQFPCLHPPSICEDRYHTYELYTDYNNNAECLCPYHYHDPNADDCRYARMYHYMRTVTDVARQCPHSCGDWHTKDEWNEVLRGRNQNEHDYAYCGCPRCDAGSWHQCQYNDQWT